MTTSLIRRAARSSQRGMTLVEIMIVLAIIGIVTTILAVRVVGKLDDANVEATGLTMQNIDGELQIYAAKHKGKFPGTSDGLTTMYKGKKVPTDAWGNDFQYFSPGTHSGNDYELISMGKDGQEGGDGANADINSWELNGEGE